MSVCVRSRRTGSWWPAVFHMCLFSVVYVFSCVCVYVCDICFALQIIRNASRELGASRSHQHRALRLNGFNRMAKSRSVRPDRGKYMYILCCFYYVEWMNNLCGCAWVARLFLVGRFWGINNKVMFSDFTLMRWVGFPLDLHICAYNTIIWL